MKRIISIRRLVVSAIFVATLSLCAFAATAWEQIQTPASVEQVDSERIDISVRDGYIYVYTPARTSVKVFSILGQLISQETIPSGTSRLKISARGIYILKIGSITRRVTI